MPGLLIARYITMSRIKDVIKELGLSELRIMCTGEINIDWKKLKDLQLLEDGRSLKKTDSGKILRLAESMLRFGLVNNLEVWQDGQDYYCFDAHHRVKALREIDEAGLKIPPLPATRCLAKDKLEAKRLLFVKESRSSWIDIEAVPEYLAQTKFDIDVASLVIDLAEIEWTNVESGFFDEPEETEEDDSVEPSRSESFSDIEHVTKTGDFWELDGHRLLCGNSTDFEDVKTLMDGHSAELLFTSPPYSDQRDYEGGDVSVESLKKFIPNFYPFAEYLAVNLGVQRREHEVFPYWNEYISEAQKIGYKFLSWNIWDKGRAGSIGMQTAIFSIQHEWILVFGKKVKTLNRTVKNDLNHYKKRHGEDVFSEKRTSKSREKDGKITEKNTSSHTHRQLSTVLTISTEQGRQAGEEDHPAVFPARLPLEYIRAMTKKREIIVDPFAGSGTTLIACEKTDRKCFLMEIEPKYCDIIIRRYSRWRAANNQDAVIKLNGESFEKEM